jgi:segregation and condensation protein A
MGDNNHNSNRYKVSTTVFEGPLDLLLQLIERAELDITKLALAQVTDQFLSYLDSLHYWASEEVSAFLVIASRLMQIKSEALLPTQMEREEGEDDPGEALARQLRLYKKYKDISHILEAKEKARLRTYLRVTHSSVIKHHRPDLDDFDIDKLAGIARKILTRHPKPPPLDTAILAPRITIREKVGQIIKTIHEKGRAYFFSLFRDVHSRLEVVVSFLALLELVKLNRVQAHQKSLFTDIAINPSDSWEEEVEFELEFGE